MDAVRNAGDNERRCIARDVLGLYGTIVTVGTYRAPSDWNAEDLKGLVTAALESCVVQHPTLTTIIRDSGSEKPYLARASNFDLANHLHFLNPTGARDGPSVTVLETLLQSVHNDPLADYEVHPQWRVYVSPQCSSHDSSPLRFHVAFASSHALADGMSGMLLHETFLAALRANGSPELPLQDNTSSLDVIPALDQATTLPLSWSFFLRMLASEFLPGSLKGLLGLNPPSPDEAWYGATSRPALPEKGRLLPTAIHIACISSQNLQGLLEACRSHRSRLTGLLNHMTARALAVALTRRGRRHEKFIVDTALDLRRCVPQAQRRLANYSSAITETHAVNASRLDPSQDLSQQDWNTIRGTTEHLMQASSTLSDHPVTLLKYVSNMREWAAHRAKTPAQGSFSVSNLGVFRGQASLDRARRSTWVVEEMVFSQSADATGSPLGVNLASAKGGSLFITFTWWPGMLGFEDETTFIAEVGTALVQQADVVARSAMTNH